MRGMPATFPAHPAAVLPLKLWRPAWFDGVALAVGSMAPDLAYGLDGTWLERPLPGLPPTWALAHSLPWFLAWALPVTIALCPLIRLSTRTLATHLPALRPAPQHLPATELPSPSPGPSPGPRHHPAALFLATLRRLAVRLLSALRGYASLGRGPRWYITAFSAGIGALSHVLWDRIALGPLDLASSLLGGLFGLWLLLRFGHSLSRTPPLTPSTAAAIPAPPPPPATYYPETHGDPAAHAQPSACPSLGGGPSVHPQPTSPNPPTSRLPSVSAAQARSLLTSPSSASAEPAVGDRGLPSPPHSASAAQALGDRGSIPLPALPPHSASAAHDGAPSSPISSAAAGGRRMVVYWGTVVAVFATGGAFLPFLPGFFLPHTTSARVIALAIAALLIGTVAASRSRSLGREPVQQ